MRILMTETLSFMFLNYFLFNIYRCFLCMYFYVSYAWLVPKDTKIGSRCPGLDLQMVMNSHVGTRN